MPDRDVMQPLPMTPRRSKPHEHALCFPVIPCPTTNTAFALRPTGPQRHATRAMTGMPVHWPRTLLVFRRPRDTNDHGATRAALKLLENRADPAD